MAPMAPGGTLAQQLSSRAAWPPTVAETHPAGHWTRSLQPGPDHSRPDQITPTWTRSLLPRPGHSCMDQITTAWTRSFPPRPDHSAWTKSLQPGPDHCRPDQITPTWLRGSAPRNLPSLGCTRSDGQFWGPEQTDQEHVLTPWGLFVPPSSSPGATTPGRPQLPPPPPPSPLLCL